MFRALLRLCLPNLVLVSVSCSVLAAPRSSEDEQTAVPATTAPTSCFGAGRCTTPARHPADFLAALFRIGLSHKGLSKADHRSLGTFNCDTSAVLTLDTGSFLKGAVVGGPSVPPTADHPGATEGGLPLVGRTDGVSVEVMSEEFLADGLQVRTLFFRLFLHAFFPLHFRHSDHVLHFSVNKMTYINDRAVSLCSLLGHRNRMRPLWDIAKTDVKFSVPFIRLWKVLARITVGEKTGHCGRPRYRPCTNGFSSSEMKNVGRKTQNPMHRDRGP